MLNWFCMTDRIFFMFAYIAPLTALFVLGTLFIEYKKEMRKRNRKKRR